MLHEIDWTFEELVSPKHTALLVIAMQNDYCKSQGLIPKAGFSNSMVLEMAPRLATLIRKAQAAGTLVIRPKYVMTEKLWHLPTRRKWRELALTRFVTLPDTWGGDWFEDYPEFTPSEQDIVVRTPSYSAFTGNELDLLLRGRGIRTLLLTGLTTNGAIEFTARTAFELNYHSVLVEDCAGAREKWLHEASLWNFEKLFGTVTRSNEVIEAWGGSS
jgi:ureidoacrylate peracid hydrolase